MKDTNDFIYLFDLLDFDANGAVCRSKSVDLPHAQSNFLYLVAKYNQLILKSLQENLPAFFKENLSEVLKAVETGAKTFEAAKKEVLQNCHPKVQELVGGSDKALILSLRDIVSLEVIANSDKSVNKFLGDFKNVSNVLEKENKLTRESGKHFNNIIQLVAKKNVEGANE